MISRRATERLGVEAPSNRQLLGLEVHGPGGPAQERRASSRGSAGVLIIIALVVGILLLGFGIVSLVALAAGGMSLDLRIFWGFVLVVVAHRRARLLRTKAAEARPG